jgi:LEA14-like dessication related protein
MRLLRIPLILAVFLTMIPACAGLPMTQRPEVQSVRPRITGLDFQGVTIDFDLNVYNPYPFAIRTPPFRYALDIEGYRFFESESVSPFDLPASGPGTVTLPVRMDYADLWHTYQALANATEADYNISGALIFPVFGRSLELPFSYSGRFPILRPPTFSDVRVQVTNVSPMGAKIVTDAAITNPNEFPLDIEGLGYVVKVGDISLGSLTVTTAGELEPGQTGRMSLTGEISAANALFGLIRGGNIGEAEILPTGYVRTPYGPASL